MTPAPRKRVRLLSVVVQPQLVIDDGTTLTPLPVQPVEVSAEEWPKYATTTFAKAVRDFERQVNETAKPAPNRATRRAAKKPKP